MNFTARNNRPVRIWPYHILVGLYVLLSAGYIAMAGMSNDDGLINQPGINPSAPEGQTAYLQVMDFNEGSAARAAGVALGDYIIGYNGISLEDFFAAPHGTRNEYLTFVKEVQSRVFHPDRPTLYSINRNGKILQIAVPFTPAGLSGLDSGIYLRFISGFCFAGLAFFIFINKPYLKTTRLFLIYAILEAAYRNLSVYNDFWPTELIYVFNLTGPLLEFLSNMVFLHFMAHFPTPRDKRQLRLFPLYLVGFVLVGFYVYGFHTMNADLSVLYWLRKSFKSALYFGALLILIVKFARFAPQSLERYKISWIFSGVAFHALSLFLFGYLPSYQAVGDFSYFSNFAQVLTSMTFFSVPLAFLLTVIRYNMFDLDTLLLKTITYSLLTALVAGIYLALTQLVDNVINPLLDVSPEISGMTTLLVALLIFNPLRERIQNLIDRGFYRKRLGDFETLTAISDEVLLHTNQSAICEYISRKFQAELALQYVSVFLADSGAATDGQIKTHFCFYHPSLAPGFSDIFRPWPRDSQFIRHLATHSGGMYLDADSLLRLNLPHNETEELLSYQAEIAFPLNLKGGFLGFLLLGQKILQTPILLKERAIIKTVVNMMAVALENANLHENTLAQERMSQELQLARTMQKTLLPQNLPVMNSMMVSADSQPAREIGGDFYEAFQGEGHWEFAAGDVSGKGAAAGLVAAITSGICYARRHNTVVAGEILAEVNNVLCQTHITGHFVAMCYVTYREAERQFSIANAGFPYPIVLSKGRAEYIKLGGLPLGNIPNIAYKSVDLVLEPGDFLILVSDGILEARNHRGEMLSFNGLIRMVENTAATDADSLRDQLFAAWRDYAHGQSEHEDDATVLVFAIR